MARTEPVAQSEPPPDCQRCPRLFGFLADWREREPSWHNRPVPTLLPEGGAAAVRLLIVGLAPGLRGANRTGRPFTGDFAGDLLYKTLAKYGFSSGSYEADPDDGMALLGCAITNAVRCVPPENKPVGAEIGNCRPYLANTIARFPQLRAILVLGRISHDSTLRALGTRPAAAPFRHGGIAEIERYRLYSSYHCSRYNTNTGRLTEEMFHSIFHEISLFLGE